MSFIASVSLDYSLSVDITELRSTLIFFSTFYFLIGPLFFLFGLFWTEKSKSFWFSTFNFICTCLQFSLSSHGRDCNVYLCPSLQWLALPHVPLLCCYRHGYVSATYVTYSSRFHVSIFALSIPLSLRKIIIHTNS